MFNRCFTNAIVVIVLLLSITSCKDDEKQTMLKGSENLYVDESIFPIVEDQVTVFQNQYPAEFKIVPLSESEVVNNLLADSTKLVVLNRKLTEAEEAVFKSKNIQPRITRFAIDAVVFVTNKKNNDSLIDLSEVVKSLKGESSVIKNLVFDNPYSNATNIIFEMAGIDKSKIKFNAAKDSKDLITFLAENEDYVGVMGLNWLTQSPSILQNSVEQLKVLAVKNVNSDSVNAQYIYPSQANIGKRSYPLVRDIYLLNYQGTAGLGMGFASFVAGDIGQRIVLQSGLAPIKLPVMEVKVKK